MKIHVRENHPVQGGAIPNFSYRPAPYLQSFFVGEDTRWFSSSAPPVRSVSRNPDPTESPEPQTQPLIEDPVSQLDEEAVPEGTMEELEEQSLELQRHGQSQTPSGLMPPPSTQSQLPFNTALKVNNQVMAHNRLLQEREAKTKATLEAALAAKDQAIAEKDDALKAALARLAEVEAVAEGLRMDAEVARQITEEQIEERAAKRRKINSGNGAEEDETKREEISDPHYDGRMDAWMRGEYDLLDSPPKRKYEDDEEEDEVMGEATNEAVDELVSLASWSIVNSFAD